jgi:hypothetical protein
MKSQRVSIQIPQIANLFIDSDLFRTMNENSGLNRIFFVYVSTNERCNERVMAFDIG